MESFDIIDEVQEEPLSSEDNIVDSNVTPIEEWQIPLPSYVNSQHPTAKVEFRLRQRQADHILELIRNTIADKSFQYSHVIRVAPRKGVKTRARSAISRLNAVLINHCCTYNQCRSAMIRLDPGNEDLVRHKVLTSADIQSSTALLDPNTPGASSLRLSWIWQNQTLMPTSSNNIQECA